jgi:regulator of replication initiation timing
MTDAIIHPPLPEVRLPAKLVNMTFNPISMNTQEQSEKNEREERYRVSQDDVSVIRKEVNKLTEAVGDLKQETQKMVEALQGNKYGNKGILERLVAVEQTAKALEDKVEDVILKAKSRETYVRIIWGLICALGSMAVTVIIERIWSPKGK